MPLYKAEFLYVFLSQAAFRMGRKMEKNSECCFWGTDPMPCLIKQDLREFVMVPFMLANIIFIWLGILHTSSFMAASNQDSLMRDNKRLTDALINENLVYYSYCDIPPFGILEIVGI